MQWQHPTGKTPESVAIVALGTSRQDYDLYQLRKGEAAVKFDEVWVVNRGLRLHRHDLAFVMDDLRREAYFDKEYGEAIRRHDRPIITSTYYEEFDSGDMEKGGIYAYPLREMAEWCARNHIRPYLKNSIPEMIAYAAFIGVRTILIHGADYTLPNGMAMEPSRANVEYWIGVCEARGIDVGISGNCRLLGRQDFDDAFVYGYDLVHEAQAQIAAGRAAASEPAQPEDRVLPG